jgi:uroporphyrinogen decarboxylase
MNKIERVTAVIEGRQPDRPPVSFWYHFGSEFVAGPPAVDVHVRHVETYDLDFLKIMDDNRYPRSALASGFVQGPKDLDRLSVLRGDEDSLGRQLELIGELAKRFGGRLRMATTLFNSWTMLRNLMAPDTGQHGPPKIDARADQRDVALSEVLREKPEALSGALEVIAESLANFARHCIAAGADGVFLSVSDDRVDTPENGVGTYDRFVRPCDLKILEGAREGSFNMLHVCGQAIDFHRFTTYPVHVINWADRYAGPPIVEVAQSMGPAICGGLDNLGTMVTGSPEDCAGEVADAIDQAGGRPIMISPGCTFDPLSVPPENLHAIRRAVEDGS